MIALYTKARRSQRAVLTRVVLATVLAMTQLLAGGVALPTVPGGSLTERDAPQVASAAGVSWYAETQHSLSGPIREWWEAHGGVAIYGFPLSEPFAWPAETGEMVVAQYFERARLEYHPSLHGTAQEVQVGRLGVEVLRERDDDPAFAEVPEDALSVWSDCIYYGETSHRICAPFSAWWEVHGGVETFGYPLSEQMQENGVLVQYFERARLEQQLTGAGDGEVAVGHLGRVDAEARGLLTEDAFQPVAATPVMTWTITATALYSDPYGGLITELPVGTTVRILDGPRNDRLLVEAILPPPAVASAPEPTPADEAASEGTEASTAAATTDVADDPFAREDDATGTLDAAATASETAEAEPTATVDAAPTATPASPPPPAPEPETFLGWLDAGLLPWQTGADPREASVATLAIWNSDASDLLRESRAYLSVAFYDPNSNTIWADGDAGPVAAASLAKSLIVTVAIAQREARGEDIGDLLSAFDLAITLSDNEITDYLWSEVGRRDGVRGFLEAHNLPGFDLPSEFDWGELSGDATAWARFFATLGSGRLLTPEHTTVVLELFHEVIEVHRWGVLAGADNRLSIGKNGWYTDFEPFQVRVNGAGFIEQRDGPPGVMPMVAVVMTRYPGDAGEIWGHEAAEALVDAALACSGQRWASAFLEPDVPCTPLPGVSSALERAESLWR